MNAAGKITILIAEDHLIVRQGLCALLNLEGHCEIVGEARTGREAVAMAAALRPDVIVMDIAMPELNGLEATRQILAVDPEAKVLVLSAHSDDAYIERMVSAGARGFLEKQTSLQVLAQAVQALAKGNRFYSPSVAKRLRGALARPRDRAGLILAKAKQLTRREREVLQLVAEGGSNKQVASKLKISIKTVEKHRQHLMDKLNIHDVATLTRYAIGIGMVEGNPQFPIL